MPIHDRRQIAPTIAQFNVGHIGHPDLVACRCITELQKFILASLLKALQARLSSSDLSNSSLQTILLHQPCYALSGDMDALTGQGFMHSGAAIATFAPIEDAGDLFQQRLIRKLSLRWLSVPPAVVATA